MKINFSNDQFKAASRLGSNSSGFLFVKVKSQIAPFAYKVSVDAKIFQIRSEVELFPGELLKVQVLDKGDLKQLQILQRFNSKGLELPNLQLVNTILNFYRSNRRLELSKPFSENHIIRKTALSALLDIDAFEEDNEHVELYCDFVENKNSKKKSNLFNLKKKNENYEELADYLTENNKDNWIIKYFTIKQDNEKINGFVKFRRYSDKLTNFNIEAQGKQYYYLNYDLENRQAFTNFDAKNEEANTIFNILKKQFLDLDINIEKSNPSMIFDGFYIYPKNKIIDWVV